MNTSAACSVICWARKWNAARSQMTKSSLETWCGASASKTLRRISGWNAGRGEQDSGVAEWGRWRIGESPNINRRTQQGVLRQNAVYLQQLLPPRLKSSARG